MKGGGAASMTKFAMSTYLRWIRLKKNGLRPDPDPQLRVNFIYPLAVEFLSGQGHGPALMVFLDPSCRSG